MSWLFWTIPPYLKPWMSNSRTQTYPAQNLDFLQHMHSLDRLQYVTHNQEHTNDPVLFWEAGKSVLRES